MSAKSAVAVGPAAGHEHDPQGRRRRARSAVTDHTAWFDTAMAVVAEEVGLQVPVNGDD